MIQSNTPPLTISSSSHHQNKKETEEGLLFVFKRKICRVIRKKAREAEEIDVRCKRDDFFIWENGERIKIGMKFMRMVGKSKIKIKISCCVMASRWKNERKDILFPCGSWCLEGEKMMRWFVEVEIYYAIINVYIMGSFCSHSHLTRKDSNVLNTQH